MDDKANSTAEKTDTRQIKLSKFTAQALRATTQRLNALAAQVQAEKARFDEAAGIHQQHLSAIIQDGGYKVEEFGTYGLWDENGDTYLRATPQA